jgi:lipopolysaccharide export system protein LptC
MSSAHAFGIAPPVRGIGAAAERAERSARAYRKAVRHTWVVRLLRWALPVGAAAGLAGFIVFPFINPFRDASVQVGLVRLDGTRVTMENPRLSGHRKDNSPYEVTAVSAIQDIRRPTIIELNGMTARLTSPDQGVMNLTAAAAIFDNQREQLQLTRDVVVRTQSGQEARMAAADVDFKAGTVKSRGGVTITLPDMTISAETMDVTESGAIVTFSGRVQAVMSEKGGAETGGAPAAAPQAPAQAGEPPTNRIDASAPPATPPRAGAAAVEPLRSGVSPARPAAATNVVDPKTGRIVQPPGAPRATAAVPAANNRVAP